MKPQNVIDHEHWFRASEHDRADICTLGDGRIVIWFVEPDVTVTADSVDEARELLTQLSYSEDLPDDFAEQTAATTARVQEWAAANVPNRKV